MTPGIRRRIIAGVVVVAAVVVSIAVAPSVWMSTGYTEARTRNGVAMKVRRWDWFPGEAVIVPAQVCDRCMRGEHSRCLASEDGYVLVLRDRDGASYRIGAARPAFRDLGSEWTDGGGGGVVVASDFRCTCVARGHGTSNGHYELYRQAWSPR